MTAGPSSLVTYLVSPFSFVKPECPGASSTVGDESDAEKMKEKMGERDGFSVKGLPDYAK